MPLISMTAYGYGEKQSHGEDGGITYTCELRTLNSRYLEASVRLPRHLLALEVDILNHVKAAMRRGKVDIFIDTVRAGGSRDLPELDINAVQHYLSLAKSLRAQVRDSGLGELGALAFADFIRLDGVLGGDRKRQGQDVALVHKPGIFAALDLAIAATQKARHSEGTALKVALTILLKDLESSRLQVASLRDQVIQALQKNVLRRLESLMVVLQKSGQPVGAALSQISAERLATEVTLASDKADIDEELTRLATHIREFHRLMDEDDGAGRKLDFLCQEMHREVNTMSNKLVQTEVAQHTLEMKQTIERVRQQVQNLE